MSTLEKVKEKEKVKRPLAVWGWGNSSEAKHKYEAYKELMSFFDIMQEEPVSEDARKIIDDMWEYEMRSFGNNTSIIMSELHAKDILERIYLIGKHHGAQWQKAKDVEKTMSWLEYHVDVEERENYKEYMKED